MLAADELHSAAKEFAARLAAGPTRAFAVIELTRGYTAGGSAAITDIYAADAGLGRMPRFYVAVAFHDLPKDSLFIGGVPRNDFVRFSIDHIAVSLPERVQGVAVEVRQQVRPPVRTRPGTGLGDPRRRNTEKSMDDSGDAAARYRLR